MYSCTHTHTHIFIFIMYLFSYTHTHILIFTRTYSYSFTHTHIFIITYSFSYTHSPLLILIYAYSYLYSYSYSYFYKCWSPVWWRAENNIQHTNSVTVCIQPASIITLCVQWFIVKRKILTTQPRGTTYIGRVTTLILKCFKKNPSTVKA